jgi:hypothetical protein
MGQNSLKKQRYLTVFIVKMVGAIDPQTGLKPAFAASHKPDLLTN